jgi:hypothetical protein
MDADKEILQERREICRSAVRSYLAERQPLAFHPQDIRRRLNAGHLHDFTIEEIDSAAAFLVGLEHAEIVQSELGATVFYRATSAGVLASEREAL